MSERIELKPSRFNVEESFNASNGGWVIVFNTFSQALAIFDHSVWERIVSGNTELELETVIEGCQRQMFLIPRNVDETRLLLARKQQLLHDTRLLSFKVVVTDYCNFSCVYCIEEGHRGKRQMSVSVARDTVNFIVEQIAYYHPKKVTLDFGGGEPLLNETVMNLISENIYFYCKGAAVDLTVSFITNGFLLSPERIYRLMQSGLKLIRVSLLPKVYQDRFRTRKNGEQTFESVIGNMESTRGLVDFHILTQYNSQDSNFIRHVPEFLDSLSVRRLKDSIKMFEIGPILRREHKMRRSDDLCGDLGDFGTYQEIVESIKKYGFSVPDGPPGNDCIAHHTGRFVIDPAGNLSCCPTMLDHPELEVGTVLRGIDPIQKSQISGRQLPLRCLEQCSLAPRCNGGCRYQALIRSGSFDGVYCNYEFHMAQLKDYMLRRAQAHSPNLNIPNAH